jgi:hypothetical protein
MIVVFTDNPKAFFVGVCAFVLVALLWTALDHYIFLPKRMKKIIAEIKKEQAQREKENPTT